MKSKNTILPTDDASRQKVRLLGYFMNYFPTAQVAAARHSMESNIKHLGEPGMTWNSDASVGDGEQVQRHLFDAMEAWQRKDWNELYYHLTALKWRSDELLHRLITRMPPFDDDSIVIDIDVIYDNKKTES